MPVKNLVCDDCLGEFEIEAHDDYPLLFCPSCGNEIKSENDHDEEEESYED